MMIERFPEFFRRTRDQHELMGLSDRELADLGVTRAQALELAHLPEDVPGRVQAMGRIFGLSEAELADNRDLWHELLQSCRHCTHLPQCARFLASGEGTPEQAGFCPNHDEFAALAG